MEIPQDVLLEATDVPPVTSVVAAVAERPPRAELVDSRCRTAELRATSGDPGGRGSPPIAGGPEALVALAELLDAPVVSTVGGKGAIPFDHPLSAASWIEDRHTTALLEDADVLLAVGTAMGEVTSNYFTFAPKGRLIHVDAEPRVLEANHPALGIHADAALALDRHCQAGAPRDTGDGAGIAAGCDGPWRTGSPARTSRPSWP